MALTMNNLLLRRWRKRLGKWTRAVSEVLALAPPRTRALVILGSFVASILDLVGLTMMLPLIIAATDLTMVHKGFIVVIESLVTTFGMPFTPAPILVVIVVGLGLKALIGVAVARYVADTVARITRDMRIRLIRALLSARWAYFVRQPVGRLAFAIGPEADAAGQCFESLSSLIACGLQVALFITMAALLSWQVLMIALAVALVTAIWFGGLVRQGRRTAKEQRLRLRQRAARFTDALIGIKPIRAMGRSERFAAVFEQEAHDTATTSKAPLFSGEHAADLQEPLIGIVLSFGFYLAITQLELHVTDLLVMSILMMKTVSALLPMQRLGQRFIQCHDQYRSLNELLDVTLLAREEAAGTRAPSLTEAIRFEDVSFSYGAGPVLRHLDLEIPAGRITAIVGPSGVGKSTIVDLLVGLYTPGSGHLRIDGHDLRELDLAAWRRGIGYVPQEVLLFHDTIERNVSLYEDQVPTGEVVAALAAAGAWSFVSQLPEGIDTVVGERGNRLSGGQRQRVSIARALLHRPRILILDEATTGLDPETERAIIAQIKALCAETGLTVLAVSHQPRWQEMADLVYRIDQGRAALATEAQPPQLEPARIPA
ncbi:MAG: ABC transporter ATP-binding protein [Geminicoccaceae bacterium]